MNSKQLMMASLLAAITLFAFAGSASAVASESAWIKLKVVGKGVETDGMDLLGKAKRAQDCYFRVYWSGSGSASGTIVCKGVGGVWQAVGGAGETTRNGYNRLFSGTCGVATNDGSAAGPCWFNMVWKAKSDDSLRSATLKWVAGYFVGSLDGVSAFYGDGSIRGHLVNDNIVPQGAKDIF